MYSEKEGINIILSYVVDFELLNGCFAIFI
jgi:hypothetical protein